MMNQNSTIFNGGGNNFRPKTANGEAYKPVVNVRIKKRLSRSALRENQNFVKSDTDSRSISQNFNTFYG